MRERGCAPHVTANRCILMAPLQPTRLQSFLHVSLSAPPPPPPGDQQLETRDAWSGVFSQEPEGILPQSFAQCVSCPLQRQEAAPPGKAGRRGAREGEHGLAFPARDENRKRERGSRERDCSPFENVCPPPLSLSLSLSLPRYSLFLPSTCRRPRERSRLRRKQVVRRKSTKSYSLSESEGDSEKVEEKLMSFSCLSVCLPPPPPGTL